MQKKVNYYKKKSVSMSKRRELTDFERGMVVGAKRVGHSISEIVTDFIILRYTVSKVRRKYFVSRINFPPWATHWRFTFACWPSPTTYAYSCVNRHVTLREITRVINEALTTDLSQRILQRKLALIGYANRRPFRVPLLTDAIGCSPSPGLVDIPVGP